MSGPRRCTHAGHGVIQESYFCQGKTRLEKLKVNAGRARAEEQPVFAKVWAVEGGASFMVVQVPDRRQRPAESEFQPCRRLGGRGGGKIARLSKQCTWLQPSSSSAPALRNAGPRQYRATLWLRKTRASPRIPLAGTPRRVEATFTCRASRSIQVETGMAVGISEVCQLNSFQTAYARVPWGHRFCDTSPPRRDFKTA
jgi:hypothetical protein